MSLLCRQKLNADCSFLAANKMIYRIFTPQSSKNCPNLVKSCQVCMARNSGHLSPHSICGLTTKIKIAENQENTSRRRSRNVLDYSELNALSSVVLYNTPKRKKT